MGLWSPTPHAWCGGICAATPAFLRSLLLCCAAPVALVPWVGVGSPPIPVPCNGVLCCATLGSCALICLVHCAALPCAALCCAVLPLFLPVLFCFSRRFLLCCPVLCCALLCCAVLFYTVPFCHALCFAALPRADAAPAARVAGCHPAGAPTRRASGC